MVVVNINALQKKNILISYHKYFLEYSISYKFFTEKQTQTTMKVTSRALLVCK